jgi:DNA polymerase delta subunit 1
MATIFQALTWHAEDTDGQHVISIFGRTDDGKSVCVSTNFDPYFFVKVSNRAQEYSMFQSMKGATGYTSVRGKDLWGFQNNQESHFMKVEFNTLADMKSCEYNLRKEDRRIRMYEANVEPLLRFMHRTGIQSTGFLSTGTNCIESSFSRCDIGLFCRDWKSLKPVDRDDNVKFIVASFDIETNSSTGKFPDPNLPGDCVFQIAVTLKRFGESEIYKKVCLCYKKTSGPDVISFATERELLLGFKKFLIENDVDIMTGWNIFGFDLEFLYVRAAMTRCLAQFSDLSKIVGRECEVVHKNLSSSALGNNELKLLPMPGRFIFDLFHVIKREKNLDSYSLNFVSKYFLGDQKIDMSAKEMFKRFEKGDPDELGEVAEYCIKDTVLPHALMDKLCNLLNLLEMAKATWVPVNYLSERGQQIKVFSQLCRKARELGFMVPTIRVSAQGPVDGYEGATVLEAQTGAYYVPITALDFEGLYPSIMIAHNFCYSTLVMNPKYDNLPGVTYETFGTHKFVQGVPSLLPEVLKELKQFRKKAKADMAAATGVMKQVYDGKQLAYKVSMNSVYGFTGASKGMLPCLAIASSVTMRGRGMIDETKNYVEANFPGAKVRYGDTDSVMVEFDVGGRTGQEAIEYSWELGEQAAEQCTALFKKPNNLELEKVYCPYFLYSKKRYAAKLWTKDKKGQMNMDKIDVKGLQLVRRDNTPYVREVCKELLDVILESKNPEGAKLLAHSRAAELLDGRVSNEKLMLSQRLGDSYKSDNLPHVQVVKKMRAREPGSEPQSGDRVPYVIVRGPKGDKAFEKSEDPVWAKQNNVKLDYEYYFTNKFMNPVCDLLEPLVPDPKDEIFGDLIPGYRKKVKCHKITDMFAKFDVKQKARQEEKDLQ